MKNRAFCDFGALGPEWWWRDHLFAWSRVSGPANTYYTTCPESLKPLPIERGIVQQDQKTS